MRADTVRTAVQPVRFYLSGLALITCLLILQSHFRLVLVVGDSMQPTLRHGDLLLADRSEYRNRDPERGDLVVAWRHRELIVKRVVGLPGEQVEVIAGDLFVNDRLVIERHRPEGDRLNVRRGQLGADRFALLGDNRGLIEGQTVHAIVSKDDIVGMVVATVPIRSSQGAVAGDDTPPSTPRLWSRIFPSDP